MRVIRRAIVVGTGLSLAFASPAWATVVGQWNMDEPAGATTMIDSSGFNNNGTLFNVTTGLAGSVGGSGDFAYGFDGSTSHVTVPKTASLVIGTNDVTISVSVNTSQPPTSGDYDLFREGGASVEIIPSGGRNRIRCAFAGSVSKLVISQGANVADGTWHTVACSKTSFGTSLTVDGTTFSKTGTVGTVKSGGKLVAIGYNASSRDFYSGMLDDVSIDISPPA